MNKVLIALVSVAFIFSSCETKNEILDTPQISAYNPLTVGKYIVYNLDSLVFRNQGRIKETHNYQVKYQVDAAITDNLNRPAYRIIRYLRKSPTTPWQSDNTFMAINTGNTLEWVENNLRFIKLSLPLKNGFSWKGNSFIETQNPINGLTYLDGWNYTYENVGQPLTLGNLSLENTLTVNHINQIDGDQSPNPTYYSEVNISLEKYAKGIGMVYKNFKHTVFQPGTGSGGFYEDGSYGITLTMIDHN